MSELNDELSQMQEMSDRMQQLEKSMKNNERRERKNAQRILHKIKDIQEKANMERTGTVIVED